MDGGKLYFYLPNNTTNPEIAVTHDGTTYSRNYQRNSAARANTYTATLLPPPTYTITIPEKVDFDSPTYQPAGSGQYNDKTFEVIPTTLTNLTDGRGLSVMVKDGGTSPSTGTDYQLTGSDSSDTLNYQVYQGASATGSALDAAEMCIRDSSLSALIWDFLLCAGPIPGRKLSAKPVEIAACIV